MRNEAYLYLWNCILSCTHTRIEFHFPACLPQQRNSKLASHLPELSSRILPNTAMDNFPHHSYKLKNSFIVMGLQQFSFPFQQRNQTWAWVPPLKAPNVPKSGGSNQKRTWLKLEKKRGHIMIHSRARQTSFPPDFLIFANVTKPRQPNRPLPKLHQQPKLAYLPTALLPLSQKAWTHHIRQILG